MKGWTKVTIYDDHICPKKYETSLDWTPSMRFASSQLSSCVTHFSLQLILSKIGQQYWKPDARVIQHCLGNASKLKPRFVLVKVFSIAFPSCSKLAVGINGCWFIREFIHWCLELSLLVSAKDNFTQFFKRTNKINVLVWIFLNKYVC